MDCLHLWSQHQAPSQYFDDPSSPGLTAIALPQTKPTLDVVSDSRRVQRQDDFELRGITFQDENEDPESAPDVELREQWGEELLVKLTDLR